MADAAHTLSPAPLLRPRIAALQYALLWAIGAGGAFVFIEPSPYEFACLAGLIIFLGTGLSLRPAFLPLALALFLLNAGYSICAAYLLDDQKIVNWILTSWYMAVTAMFFAMVLAEDTGRRLDMLCRGYLVGAVIASLLGIAGYFGLVPGGEDTLTLYGRARGTFKDPNVYGAFLVFPALLALQGLVTGTPGKMARSALALAIITLAILLSFSRAAWGQVAVAGALMLGVMFVASSSKRQRLNISVIAIAAMVALAALVAVLLSLEQVAALFKERASFDQSYDVGRFGRFGRHLLGAQMALEMPFGIGPLQFTRFFPEDTHNSYLNAFMSGGWLSGVTYPALALGTLWLGFRHLFVRVPWQRTYIAVFAAYAGTVGESFIIDTDHWRHFFLMLGALWGMMAAAHAYAGTYPGRMPVPARA